MASPADAPPRHPKRLRIEDLERYARARLAQTAGTKPAMLALGLQRGDRMRALAGRPDSFALLADLLDRVERSLRPEDRYAVVSVTEVWIVLASAPAESIVRLAAAALRANVEDFYVGRFADGTEHRVAVRATVGAAWLDRDGATTDDITATAGRALAEARRHEDRIVVLRTTEDQMLVRARLEGRVRAALEANALEVWFQPQIALSDRRCHSLEALIRWPRDDADPVSPQMLVATCEQSGLIGELTRFTVNNTLRQMMVWGASGVEPAVGINLSALTLDDSSFPSQVAQACETWGIPSRRLLFELTESSIASNENATLEFMRRLRELGCELSIDDFGTGYSSFAYLRQFPVNELKIDRAFIRELTTQSADRRIVKVLIEIAHAFGLRALAEGAEDEATVRILDELGCDSVQGWHFARAMPGDEVAAWISAFAGRSSRAAPALGTA